MLAIIAELQNTLDLERGGKIATDLDSLYDWVTSRLLDATVQQNVRPIDDVVRVLEPFATAGGPSPPQPARRLRTHDDATT